MITVSAGEARELFAREQQAQQEMLREPGFMAELLDPGWASRAHNRLISRELAAVARGEVRRLLVAVPPQTGKSTLAAEWFPFWWLCRNPSDRVVIGSYGATLATNRGRVIRKKVAEHGHRFGLELEYGATGVAEWSLASGGGVKSTSVGGGVTGSPANLAIVDDPHKSRAEAESVVARNAVWDWWSADLMSRLSPNAPVVLVMTLWHVDDLAARVLKHDGTEDEGGLWRVVRLPAFADTADDPLGRLIGEPLPHPRIPEHDVDAARAHWETRRKATIARDWFALYQADPKPVEGALLTADELRAGQHFPPPAKPRKHAVGIDPSGGGRDVAGIIGGFLGDDQRVYWTHDRSVAGPTAVWARRAVELAAEIDADYFVVEKNYGGDMADMVLRAAWRQAQDEGVEGTDRPMPQIKLVTSRKSKLLRAEPIAQLFKDDRVRLGANLVELAGEWQSWQPTDPDSPGRIDASVHLAFELMPRRGQGSVAVPPSAGAAGRVGGVPRGAVVAPSLGVRRRR